MFNLVKVILSSSPASFERAKPGDRRFLDFQQYECPITGKPCPHPDLCGLTLRPARGTSPEQ